jgi:serine/threonine protein kinase, bacterial
MVILTLLDTQQQTPQKQWHFDNSSVIRIGRSADNHVVLTNTLVSRRHLELIQVSDGWRMVNKGTNGTFVNGIMVEETQLPDNSLLQLAKGGPLLKFQQEQQVNTGKPSVPQKSVCSHEGNPPSNLFCIHCGQPISIQNEIRQYQVLRTLGQGGMGTTFLAWEEKNKILQSSQLVVLKQMNADMAKIAKAQELFEREAYILKSLNHPGIPKYYDFFVDSGKKYLAMELIHGQDLERWVITKGPVTANQATEWAIQTCEILDYIHGQQPPLIHRDIKPANLMARTGSNKIVVLDFGAVKEIGTTPGTRIGAEGYCSPEQQRGQPVTQSDLYAIGPTIIFLVTGENPFKYYRLNGRSYRFDINSIPTITPKLKEVIENVTEPLPKDRFQTAQELADALRGCLKSLF